MTRSSLLTGRGILLVASAMTLLALLENSVLPWAPFFLLYAALTIAIPIWVGRARFTLPREIRRADWLAALGAFFLFLIGSNLIVGLLQSFLLSSGVTESALLEPYYSLGAAQLEAWRVAAERFAFSQVDVQRGYLIMILLWAGLGEELFYRGYVHGGLRAHHSALVATLVSAFFYAIRHATQLALVSPFPWPAALTWVAVSFLFGFLMSYVYERSGSLTLPVLVHYMWNLLSVFLSG